MESYRELSKRHMDEFETLPIFWAYSNKQLEEGMQSFNLSMSDVKQIRCIGQGGYMRATETHLLNNMTDRHRKEFMAAVEADENGDGFAFEMFDYELGNREFCITGDVEPTLDCLGLGMDDIEKNPLLKKGLQMAIKENYHEQ